MLEYSSIPFNKDAFLTTLKRKYWDYNNDYTKHTHPFFNTLVLLVQYK